jgi:hypothetical protein
MTQTQISSPYCFDDPEKVHALGFHLGGRRLKDGTGGRYEVWKFKDRNSMWNFANVLTALGKDTCIASTTQDRDAITIEYYGADR